MLDLVRFEHFQEKYSFDRLPSLREHLRQVMTTVHQASVVVEGDQDFEVGSIDLPAVYGNLPDRRISAFPATTVPIHIQNTPYIRFVHGQVFTDPHRRSA